MLLAYCCHFALSLSCCMAIANAGTLHSNGQLVDCGQNMEYQVAGTAWCHQLVHLTKLDAPVAQIYFSCHQGQTMTQHTHRTWLTAAIATLGIKKILAWHPCRLTPWLMQHNSWRCNTSHGIHCTSLADSKSQCLMLRILQWHMAMSMPMLHMSIVEFLYFWLTLRLLDPTQMRDAMPLPLISLTCWPTNGASL